MCIGGDSNGDGGTEACFTGGLVTANIYGKALSDFDIEQLYEQYDTFDFIADSGYKFDLRNRYFYVNNQMLLTVQNISNAFTNENLYVETENRIGTGTKIVLKNSSKKIYDTAEVVLFGDVNGDGVCDVLDVSESEQALNRHIILESFFFEAADCNGDEEIGLSDYSAVVNKSLGFTN